MWQASHLGAVDSLIIADVGSNDMDEIVEVACHEMTADDFGTAATAASNSSR